MHPAVYLVAAAFFMENLDSTAIATALPHIADSLERDAVDVGAGITAYMLSLAVFIPASAWLAGRFGPRRVFMVAIVVFMGASMMCGLASSLPQFLLARFTQGVGAAMMSPVGRAVVLRATPKRDLMRAVAYITWPGLTAPLVGPPLGGLIATYASWRWIFFVNIPLGLIALVAARRLLPDDRATAPVPFDRRGFLLVSGGCCSLVLALELIGGATSNMSVSAALLVCSAVIAVLAVGHLRRVSDPLLSLRPFRVTSYLVSVRGGSLFRIAVDGAPFLLPLLFQLGFGMTAFEAGTLMIAMFLGNLLMKPATSFVIRRYGFRQVLLVNGAMVAVTVAGCALMTSNTPSAVIVATLFVQGVVRSLHFTALATLAFADVARDEMHNASTMFSMAQQLSRGLAAAIALLVLRVASLVTPDEGSPAVIDFRIAFVVLAVLTVVAVADSRRLPPGSGSEVSGHRIARAA